MKFKQLTCQKFQTVYSRQSAYFKHLTPFLFVYYIRLPTDKKWAKSIFDHVRDFSIMFDFYWHLLLTAIHKEEIDNFHNHLNKQNADIQFSKEIEENGKLPFLDCLVSRNNNELWTTVYRKLMHTDRLLDKSSHNPTSQSHDYNDFDETSATSLWHTRQPTWWKQIPWTCFSQKQLQHWLY